jgi:hypothetical protein
MPQPDFNQVCSEFQQFRAIIDRALASPGDAAVKQRLQSVTATLDQTFAELREVYPKAQAELDAELAGVHKTTEETAAKLAGVKQNLAAASEAGAAVPAPGQRTLSWVSNCARNCWSASAGTPSHHPRRQPATGRSGKIGTGRIGRTTDAQRLVSYHPPTPS